MAYDGPVEHRRQLQILNECFSRPVQTYGENWKDLSLFGIDLDLYNKISGKLSDAELKDIFIISKLSIELDVKLTEKTQKHLFQLWAVFADFYNLKEGKVYENFSQISSKGFLKKMFKK